MNKLHIGYHKTGTTWLQQLIFPNVPNYVGRNYDKNKRDFETMKIQLTNNQIEGADNLLNHFSKLNNIFYSCEIFSNIPNKALFKLLNKYPSFSKVLVTTRNFDSIITSRTRHDTNNFYLQPKLRKGIIDDEVKQHYSTSYLKNNIKNLTIVNMDKIWEGDKNEIIILSNFLEYDINKLITQNKNIKINTNRK